MSRRIITLGTWDGRPIEWCVLKQTENGTLVISKYPLLSSKFHVDSNDTRTWAYSQLRLYLNNTFYQEAFTDEEKRVIINSYLHEPDSTKDNVFVLSQNEASELMESSEFRYSNSWCSVSGGCINCYKEVLTKNKSTCCWLRDPVGYRMGPNDAFCSSNSVTSDFSVRPSIRIKE